MAEDGAPADVDDPAKSSNRGSEAAALRKKQRRGVVARLWRGIFGDDDDFQKRLEHLSKEEASVLARLKRRAHSSRKTARNIVLLSVFLEVVAVSYAVVTTRSEDLDWKMRAIRVLPMFVLPALSTVIYSALVSFTRILDNKDHKTLERLRAERQAKIDELKEKTNYYTTQQLIQRYDLDPATKAAAASVLASKLGADSGLRFHVGDESNVSASGKSYDAELVQSAGLRNRKPSQARGHSTGSSTTSEFIDETLNEYIADTQEIDSPNQRVVERLKGSALGDRGWLARVAALLVGEDPTQCYALICAHCHMHNGLAKKEDFSYITYYCPHCHGLNASRRSEEQETGLSSGKDTPTSSLEGDNKSTVASSLAAVEEIPGRTENEFDSTASSAFDTRDSCRV
ncbi:putative integral membrane metal-binding protein (DUF2296) [Musa troglodytarum]|uniref:Integral membrane metal-binding protein (DUF2296) n=1 Tax=Musa troglodytarum TaxID=320322 RepID=A0A9E7JA75_9LILI|nr:putative integral membrane metal-binding protein (DUF2296) [Musa troglodytarum]